MNGTKTYLKATANTSVELNYNNSKKFETTNAGAQFYGTIRADDGNYIKLGSSDDLQLYHASNNSHITNTYNSGYLHIKSDNISLAANSVGENMLVANVNGAVSIYYDGVQKLRTDPSGILTYGAQNTFYGASGGSNAELHMRCTGGAVYNSIKMWNAAGNSKVEFLSHGGSTLFTYADHYNICISGTETIEITSTGVHPRTTSINIDLGTSTKRWRNIYTQDLQLSNETSGGNEVDGTWGNYTIQEGESDLFLINRRNGKKYKFNLTEVS